MKQETAIRRVLQKIDFGDHVTLGDVVKLRGTPFALWPENARYPWWWLGSTKPERIDQWQYKRARARIRIQDREVSPARVLYHFFTGEEPPAGGSFHHVLAKALRGYPRDDVNPARYVCVSPRISGPAPKLRTFSVKPNEGLLWLMFETNFYPSSVEELIERFPEAADIPRDVLEVTIHAHQH